MSLSDGGVQATMPVAPTGMMNSGFGGFGWGGDGAWLIILFLIFAVFGWGGNGWGNNAGNSGGVVDGYVLASDFANIERKLDAVNNGICDSTFALNNAFTCGLTPSIFGSGALSFCSGSTGSSSPSSSATEIPK